MDSQGLFVQHIGRGDRQTTFTWGVILSGRTRQLNMDPPWYKIAEIIAYDWWLLMTDGLWLMVDDW